MSEGWQFSQSFARMETDGQQERLHCDYAITVSEPTRKNILLRRALAILAIEEKRLYALTDAQALEELDALKAKQDGQEIRVQ